MPLGEGVYAGRPKHAVSSTTTDALVHTTCAWIHTHLYTHRHNDNIFLQFNSQATFIKAVCHVHPHLDREKSSLVCSLGPQPLKWSFCVVEASDLA